MTQRNQNSFQCFRRIHFFPFVLRSSLQAPELPNVPLVTVYLFISKLEQHTRGLKTRREDADKGRHSGGAQQTLFSGLKVALR